MDVLFNFECINAEFAFNFLLFTFLDLFFHLNYVWFQHQCLGMLSMAYLKTVIKHVPVNEHFERLASNQPC